MIQWGPTAPTCKSLVLDTLEDCEKHHWTNTKQLVSKFTQTTCCISILIWILSNKKTLKIHEQTTWPNLYVCVMSSENVLGISIRQSISFINFKFVVFYLIAAKWMKTLLLPGQFFLQLSKQSISKNICRKIHWRMV